jgi:hypothetical protein
MTQQLQKYHRFRRDVSGKAMAGDISNRALKSKFASDLPMLVVKEFKAMRAAKKPCKPTSENSQALSYQMGHDNRGSTSYSSSPSFEGLKFGNYQNHCSVRSHNVKNLDLGGFGFNNVSDVRGNNASEFQAASNNEGNAYANIEFQQQKLDKNVMENEHNYNVGTSINEVKFNQMKSNLSNLLMADDMNEV